MIRGLYTSALGMTSQMKRLDVVSNNIANSDTSAFKRDTPVVRSFSEELLQRLDDTSSTFYAHSVPIGRVSLGVFVDDVSTDFSAGGMQQTDAPLDLAMSGDGFFAVNVTDGNGVTTEKYTRDGAFTISADRTLITKEGNTVVGTNGAVRLDANADVVVDPSGNIFANGRFIDRLKVIDFQNYDSLRKFGNNLFDATPQSVQIPFRGGVIQGAVETSNVNIVKEMVELINVSRIYEANQKMITMFDTTLEQAASRIAMK